MDGVVANVLNVGRNACNIGECYKEKSEIIEPLKEGGMYSFRYREGKVLGLGGKTNFNADYTDVEAKFTKYGNVFGVGDTIEVEKASVKIDGILVPNTYEFFYLNRIVKNSIEPITEETIIGDTKKEIRNIGEGARNFFKANAKQPSEASDDTEALLKTLKSSWNDKVLSLIPNVDVVDITNIEDIKKMNEMLDSAASYISPFIQYEQIIKSLGISGQKIPIEFLEELSKIVNRFGDQAIPAIKSVNSGGTLYKDLSEFKQYFADYKRQSSLNVYNDLNMNWEGDKPVVKPDDKPVVKKGLFIGLFKSTFSIETFFPVVLNSEGKFLISQQMKTGPIMKLNASKYLCPNSIEGGRLLFTFNRSTCGNKDTRKSKSKSIIGITSGVVSGVSGVASGIAKYSMSERKSAVTPPKGGKKRLTKKMRKQKK